MNYHKMLCLAIIAIIVNLKDVQGQSFNRLKNKLDRKIDEQVDKVLSDTDKQPAEATAAVPKPGDGTASGTRKMAAYSKYDFIAGDSILYFQDFADAIVGELPDGWNSNSGGNIAKVSQDNSSWLNLIQGTYLSDVSLKSFGEHYTIEFDLIFNVTPQVGYYLPSLYLGAMSTGSFTNTDNRLLADYRQVNAFECKVEPYEPQSSKFTLRSYAKSAETITTGRIEHTSLSASLRKVVHFAIAVKGSRLRIWIDESKIFDLPNAVNKGQAINQLFFKTI